jgi:hypothetical protein
MLLRALVLGLLLANAVFFAWARGWFAPTWPAPRHGEREPERLAAQVQPEAVTLLATTGAGPAAAAARAAALQCFEAGPLEEAGLAAGEAALVAAQLPGGSWTRLVATPAPTWLVYAGRVANEAARQLVEADLRLNGLTFELIDAPTELAPGLVLSRHLSRAQADAALAQVTAATQGKGKFSTSLKGLRVVALPTPPAQYWLRADKADAALQARLNSVPKQDANDALAGGFKPCALRP